MFGLQNKKINKTTDNNGLIIFEHYDEERLGIEIS